MFSSYTVLKTFQDKQVLFLIEQRKSECSTAEELRSALLDDLWSRRYGLRRISVPYELLQHEVAKKLYWQERWLCFLKVSTPNLVITEENKKWLICLHRAADMINDCCDLGYLDCVGGNVCDLIQITPKGSQYSLRAKYQKFLAWSRLLGAVLKIAQGR